MKRLLAAAAVVAGTVVTGASAFESMIYPGVGIGKVKLGMTQTQVKKVLGKWSYVNEKKGKHLSAGWGLAQWTVDFFSGRVVQVATSVHSQRTTSGVGTGSSWRATRARVSAWGVHVVWRNEKPGPVPRST